MLQHAEEKEGFEVPQKYLDQGENEKKRRRFGTNDGEQGQERRDSGSGGSARTAVEGGDDSESLQQDGQGEEEGEKDDKIMADWYGDDDPENPQNWYVQPRS